MDVEPSFPDFGSPIENASSSGIQMLANQAKFSLLLKSIKPFPIVPLQFPDVTLMHGRTTIIVIYIHRM